MFDRTRVILLEDGTSVSKHALKKVYENELVREFAAHWFVSRNDHRILIKGYCGIL